MAEEEKKTPEGQQPEQPEQQAQPTRPAPITNPKLLEAIAQFKSETNRVNEIKFLQEMLNARYLVPVIMETPPNETMKPGERVSTRVAFQMLTNDKNEKFIPAFTDQDELVKNTVQPRHQVAVLTVRDFAMVFSQNPICKGFVINPFGDNMCLTREQLENLFQHARQVPRQQDGKVLVGGAPSLSSQVDMAMNNLKKEKGTAILFITHDLSVVHHFSNDIAVMYLGKLIEKAPSDELFKNPTHPYTQALLSAIPLPNIHKKLDRVILKGEITSPIEPKPVCRFANRCNYATDRCRSEEPQLKEISPGHFVSCFLAE